MMLERRGYDISVAHSADQAVEKARSERFDFGARYTPAPGKALSASYRYTRQFIDPTSGQNIELKQFDIAAQQRTQNEACG